MFMTWPSTLLITSYPNNLHISLIVSKSNEVWFRYGKPYSFNGKEFFDGNWHYCETFKLTFDDNNNLIDIENIKFDN